MITRSTTKNIWILAIISLLAGTALMYRKAEDLQITVSRKEDERRKLTRELRAGNLHSAAIADLDNFTINEASATTLDILRHLDLEESDLEYRTISKTSRKIGGSTLYTRKFTIKGVMAYQEALAQADWLHNTNKVVINKIMIRPADKEEAGNLVELLVEGTLYGLDKS
jgi:hypothetical protein